MRARFFAGMTVGLTVAAVLTTAAPGALASGSPAATRTLHRWHNVSPAPDSALPIGSLGGPTCFAPATCLVFGSDQVDNTLQAFLRIWNGRTWSPKRSFLPQLPATQACASARSCTAIGLVSGSSGQAPMAEHWDGVHWTLQQTPAPPAGSIDFGLSSISCPTVSSCTAIGSYRNRRGPAIPIAEQWNGINWTLQTIPGPPNKTFEGFGAGLSCASARFCVAVGNYSHGLFADTWNGAGWQARLITGPVTPPPFINAISCSSSKACLAVGLGIAEHWNGTHWQAVPPVELKAGDPVWLNSVSCASATNCEAITYPGAFSEVIAEQWRLIQHPFCRNVVR